jgi:hypothetical protein
MCLLGVSDMEEEEEEEVCGAEGRWSLDGVDQMLA